MTAYNIQPLESYRLGAYQLPVPCYLCESANLFDAQWCRNCHAPMEMMRIAANPKLKTHPQVIPILGASNVGKTVYLGMLLDILARQHEELEFSSCDAATVAMQQESMSLLARGCFPQATYTQPESWRWAHCRMKRRTSRIMMESFMLDLGGTSLLDEIERPGSYPVIGNMIRKATGFMLIVDVDRIQRGDKDEEFFALQILGHVQNVLDRLKDENRRDGHAPRGIRGLRAKSIDSASPPLSIVQMKSDRVPRCADDPAHYARGQMPNLWQFCKDRFARHRFFAASAIGACAHIPARNGGFEAIPLRVEPSGIMPPFRWLFSQFTP